MTEALAVWPAFVLALALGFGPGQLVGRIYLRLLGGARFARRWARPVARGGAGGMVLATLFAGQSGGLVALLCLLFLLASMDWRWRWLPVEWTGAIIVLAAASILTGAAPWDGVLRMAVPALTLLALRQGYLFFRGVEAMGLGDVWLMVGLGGYLSLVQSFLLVGIAAALGLMEVAIRRYWQPDATQRNGVAYGTHLCVVFICFMIFAELK